MEKEIYILSNGEEVDVTYWPEDYKFLFLAENVGAKKKDIPPSVDTSMFGENPYGEGGRVIPALGLDKSQADYNLERMTQQLFDTADYDKKVGLLKKDSLWDLFKIDTQSDEYDLYTGNFDEKDDFYQRIEDYKSGKLIPFEEGDYEATDWAKFNNNPNLEEALRLGLISTNDLKWGMYPGHTDWVDQAASGGAMSEDGVIAWKNEMPHDSKIERKKRASRRKVDRFLLKSPYQIDTEINARKLNQPYIFEEYAENDNFLDEVYDTEFLTNTIDNFNVGDFNGFMVNRGHKKYLKDYINKNLHTSDYGTGDIGSGNEQAIKAYEGLKLHYVNLYLNEQITRDLLQQKLLWEKNNPGKDADTEGIQFNLSKGNIKLSGLKDWMKVETPTIYAMLEEQSEKTADEYQKLINSEGNVGTGEFLLKVAGKGWEGFSGLGGEMITSGMELLPGEYSDNYAEAYRQRNILKGLEEGDHLRYVIKRGYTLAFPEYGNITYLVDPATNRIYDTTNKMEATSFLSSSQKQNIINKTKEEGKIKTSFSGLGTAYESARIVGDLFFQVSLTMGVGIARKAVGGFTTGLGVLGKTKAFLRTVPVSKLMGDAIIAQSTIGFSRGYEETLLAARNKGIPEDEARELAARASAQTGLWYALTAPLSPQTKATEIIFGKRNMREFIEVAVERYAKSGWQGWGNFMKDAGSSFSLMGGEGFKELFQETVQQSGETFGIGKDINRQAGMKIRKESMNLEDYLNTMSLSFIAGMAMPGGGMVFNTAREQVREFMGLQNVDRFNALAYMAYRQPELKKLLTKQVDNNVYTQEEADNLIEEVSLYKETINSVPSDMSAKGAKTILHDIKQLAYLENQKKNSVATTGFDKKIQILKDRINTTYFNEITAKSRGAIIEAAKAGIAGENLIFAAIESEEELKEYLRSIDPKMSDATINKYSKQFGIMIERNGKRYAIENKYAAKNNPLNLAKRQFGRMTQTAQHEFKHALMWETVANDPEAQELLGKALTNEIFKLELSFAKDDDDKIINPTEFKTRLAQYVRRFEKIKEKLNEQLTNNLITKDDYARKLKKAYGNQWEEAINLYSEAVGKKLIKYDEGVVEGIKNDWRRALQLIGAKDIELGSGKDVFNMIMDYNKAIESGWLKWNKAFKKMGTKGAKVDKKNLRKEKKEWETKTKPTVAEENKKKTEKTLQEIEGLKKLAEEITERNKKRSATKTPPKPRSKSIDDEEKLSLAFDDKFSLITPKRLTSDEFKENINQYYDKDLFTTLSGVDSVVYEILKEYRPKITNKIYGTYSRLPNVLLEDIIFETEVFLLQHIRNFNREFLELRDKYKDALLTKGIDKSEIKDLLNKKDIKGYTNSKGKIVKHNNNLNGWINSQLGNKIMSGLKTKGVTEKDFKEDYDPRTMGGAIDESNTEKQELKFEEEQSKLVELLTTPIFGFVNEDGTDIIIPMIPLAGGLISSSEDPMAAVNVLLKTEDNPSIVKQLNQQKRNLKRGLELEAKSNLTKNERDELKSLKNFQAYDLGSGSTIKTFQALTMPLSPVRIIISEVEKRILNSPNIESLEFRNFKDKFLNLITPLARKMTFKNREELDLFMYNNWKLIYDVINNPIDPVTGESTYAAKKLPDRLKEFNDEGKRIKVKKPTRALFLQTLYGKPNAAVIIRKFSKNSAKELKQLGPLEINEKTGKEIGLTGFFDRRTALMELFGDVVVLQQARKSLRNPVFLNKLANKNNTLSAALKNETTKAEIINNLASGKSSIVKLSLTSNDNGKVNPYLASTNSTAEQVLLAQTMDNAKMNNLIKSKSHEVKNSIKFNVPNLGNWNDKAISLYLIDKFSLGYNNFEFRNLKNSEGKLTKRLLKEGDVKFSGNFDYNEYSKDFDKALNQIIAENTNISPDRTVKSVEAKMKAANKDGWFKNMWLPPEDMDYVMMLFTIAEARGKKGEKQFKWLKDNLYKPYMEGNLNLQTTRQTAIRDWKALTGKKYPKILNKLRTKIPNSDFTYDDAVRVYLWQLNSFKIPGITEKEIFELSQIVRNDPILRDFARDLSILTKQPQKGSGILGNGYLEPDENWSQNTLTHDINIGLIEKIRSKSLARWIKIKEFVFTQDNLNKLESVYGSAFKTAIENILHRMTTGSSKPGNLSDVESGFLRWLNGSIGVTMFLNMRSAMLQTISTVNFINTSDNNALQFGLALGNLPQMRKDFVKLWNSDYLVDRRRGMLNDLQEQELQAVINNPKYTSWISKINAAINWSLKKGFLPTRFADSFAIALGGATFYRNRINTYRKEGFEIKEAEDKAFFDFYEIAEESQQSGDPSKLSQNQAGLAGRLFLAFQNTPLQYGRIIKRSAIDISKGRGSFINNLSKITYYGAIQAAMFAFLQNALFARLWDDDEFAPEDKYKKQEARMYNSWMDSLLRGGGLKLAWLAWAKNIMVRGIELWEDPKGAYKQEQFTLALADGLIPIGIKFRKLQRAFGSAKWNAKEVNYIISEEGYFSLNNPYLIEGLLLTGEGALNIPGMRIYTKAQNLKNSMNTDFERWQRAMFFMGYTTWNLGLEDGKTNRKNKSNELDFGIDLDFDLDLDFDIDLDF